MPEGDVNRSRSGGPQTTVIRALLSVPVAVKVMGIVLGVAILFSFGMLWSIHQTWHAALRRELDGHATALAADLARSCAGVGGGCDDAALRRRLAEARALDEGVEYVFVQDANGVVIAHTLTALPLPQLAGSNELGPGRDPHLALVEIRDEKIHDAAVPIAGGRGWILRVGISERHIGAQVGWLARRLAVVTLAIAGISLAGAWLLTRILARPVHELVAATRSLQEGRLDVVVPVHAKDEIGELATRFNEMAASLKEQARERQRLVRKVMGAAEAERKRLARELHDETGQALTSLIAGLSALETRSLPGAIGEQLAEIRRLAEETLRDIQDVSRALRPSALDDFGLESALRRQCESSGERLGCAVELQTIGMDGNPSDRNFNGSSAIGGVANATPSTHVFDDAVLNDSKNYDYKVVLASVSDTLFFYHLDHLATPIAMTNGSGTLQWRAELRPFGDLQSLSASVPNNLRFPGQYADAETSYYQNWHRDYLSRAGRFAEADRFLDPSWREPGPYLYARARPTRFSDRFGLFAIQGSCDCAPTIFGNGISKGVAQACSYPKKPACRDILSKYKGGDTLRCLMDRCEPGGVPINCNSDQRDCGQFVLAGVMTIGRGGSGCPAAKGLGYGPTIFHEAIHSCGFFFIEPSDPGELNDIFYNFMKVCTGFEERP